MIEPVAATAPLPACPVCKAFEMCHKCYSHAPGTAAFRRNGWYCSSCGVGPLELVSAACGPLSQPHSTT